MVVRPGGPDRPAAADAGTANPARVYDALLGGKDNFAADREAAAQLAAAKPASDVDPEAAAEAARRYDSLLPTTQTNRTRAEVIRFFDGLQILEPGVVQLNTWRPDPGDPDPGIEISSWGGLGRRP